MELEAVILNIVKRLRKRNPDKDIFISRRFSSDRVNIHNDQEVEELLDIKSRRYHFFDLPGHWTELTNPARTAYNTAMIALAQSLPVPSFDRMIYRHLGAYIGNNGTTGVNSKIDNYYPRLIEIGDRVALGFGSIIASHFSMEFGHVCIGKTRIGERTLVGLEAFIGPVVIGKNVRINPRSVVMRDIPDNAIAAGNPARIVGYKK